MVSKGRGQLLVVRARSFLHLRHQSKHLVFADLVLSCCAALCFPEVTPRYKSEACAVCASDMSNMIHDIYIYTYISYPPSLSLSRMYIYIYIWTHLVCLGLNLGGASDSGIRGST